MKQDADFRRLIQIFLVRSSVNHAFWLVPTN